MGVSVAVLPDNCRVHECHGGVYRNALCGRHYSDVRQWGEVRRPAIRERCFVCAGRLPMTPRRTADCCSSRCSSLRIRYGLNPTGFRRALSASHCDGCGVQGRYGVGQLALHIDHHHESGRVRGVLHSNCNRAVGHARESSDVLLAAARYLGRPGLKPELVPALRLPENQCHVCSATFNARASGRRQITCSIECRSQHQNHLILGVGRGQQAWLRFRASGRCELCNFEFVARERTPHLDHNHDTGEIRGLLHADCNSLLGAVEENTRTLVALALYLNRGGAAVPYGIASPREGRVVLSRTTTTSRQQRWLTSFEACRAIYATGRVPSMLVAGEKPLSRWVAKQRTRYREGKLEQGCVESLESLPSWSWAPRKEGRWF